MKKIKLNRTFAVLILVVIIGITLFYVIVGLEFEISVTQIWGRITKDAVEIKTIITVNNPTPLPRRIKRISFDLCINGLKIASELKNESTEVEPFGKTEILLTSFLNNSIIIDLWVTYVSKDNLFEVKLLGNVTFSSMARDIICPIDYKISAHTDLLELLNIHDSRDIRVGPASLTLKSSVLSWGQVTQAQTEMNSSIIIYNPNSYPVTIKEINYTMEMNNVKVAEGSINKQIFLKAKDDCSASFIATLNNALLNEWWDKFLENDQITAVILKLNGTADVLGKQYTFPIIEATAEASIDILGATVTYGYIIPAV